MKSLIIYPDINLFNSWKIATRRGSLYFVVLSVISHGSRITECKRWWPLSWLGPTNTLAQLQLFFSRFDLDAQPHLTFYSSRTPSWTLPPHGVSKTGRHENHNCQSGNAREELGISAIRPIAGIRGKLEYFLCSICAFRFLFVW